MTVATSIAIADDDPLSFFLSVGGAHQRISTGTSSGKYAFSGVAPKLSAGIRYQATDKYGFALSGGALLGTVDDTNISFEARNYTVRNQTTVIVNFEPSYFMDYNHRIFGIAGASTYKMALLGDNINHLNTKPHYGLGYEVRLTHEFSVILSGIAGKASSIVLSTQADPHVPLNPFKYYRFGAEVVYTL